MQLLHTAAEQLTTWPSVETPVAVAGSFAVSAIASATTWLRHRSTGEKYAVHTPNPALLEKTLVTVHGDVKRADKRTRPGRLAGSLLALVGFGTLAASQLGDLTYASTSRNTNANNIIVLDTSYSMATEDVGAGRSRLEVALEGLGETDYAGNLAVVEFGRTNSVRVPLGHEWEGRVAELANREVDQNGGDLGTALQRAAELLPIGATENGQGIRRNGTITVISDGTVDTPPDEVAQIAQTSGADVRVIVPGTPDASYVLAGTEVNSGIQTDRFASLGDNVTVAEDAAAITHAISTAVEDSGKTTHRRKWRVLDLLGLGLLAGGVSKTAYQLANRKV